MAKKYPKKSFILLLLTALFFASGFEAKHDKNYNVKLQILNNKNQQVTNFLVKIAKSAEERERGLMFVTNLPKNYGMLFEFHPPQMIYMWMKNTKIPLDMLFIDKNNQIISIKHNATPESLSLISSEKIAAKVLEINGGMANEKHINIGDSIKIE